MFWFRLAAVHSIVRPLFWVCYRRCATKFGIHMPTKTDVGGGFRIGHSFVTVNPTAKIGNNVTLMQYSTIGSNFGQAATIGDCVWIGPGCCVVENVHIGKNAVIGAGAVVVKDIPDNAVAVGVPARVIKIREAAKQP